MTYGSESECATLYTTASHKTSVVEVGRRTNGPFLCLVMPNASAKTFVFTGCATLELRADMIFTWLWRPKMTLRHVKISWISQWLQQYEFLFIQEHWLADCQLYVLNNIHSTHASSGFNNDDIVRGRPYGGCAILWHADLHAEVHFVATNNKRVYALCECETTHCCWSMYLWLTSRMLPLSLVPLWLI